MKNTILTVVMSLIIGGIIGFLIEKRETIKIQKQYEIVKNESFTKDFVIMKYEYMIELASEDTACKRVLDHISKNVE